MPKPKNFDYGYLKADPEFGKYYNHMEQTGKKYNIDPDLLAAWAITESGFDSNAKNTKGSTALGLYQYLDGTHQQLQKQGIKFDRRNPIQSIDATAKYYKYLSDQVDKEFTFDHLKTPEEKQLSKENIILMKFKQGESGGKKYSAKLDIFKGDTNAYYNQVQRYREQLKQQRNELTKNANKKNVSYNTSEPTFSIVNQLVNNVP